VRGINLGLESVSLIIAARKLILMIGEAFGEIPDGLSARPVVEIGNPLMTVTR
jgi:hypothetical protein